MGKKSKSKNKHSKHKYNATEAYFQSNCPCVINNSCQRVAEEYASAEASIAAAGYRPSIAPAGVIGLSAYPIL